MELLLAIFLAQMDEKTFFTLYSPFGMAFNFVFAFLGNFCIIFCIALTHIYKQKSEDVVGVHQIEGHFQRRTECGFCSLNIIQRAEEGTIVYYIL